MFIKILDKYCVRGIFLGLSFKEIVGRERTWI